MPRVFATGILAKNAQEAIERINASGRFDERQKVQAARIIRKLISARSRSLAGTEEAESRVDYISDHLGIEMKEVIQIVNLLKEEKILADTKDITAFIKRKGNVNRSLDILNSFARLESFLLNVFGRERKRYNLKELNGQALASGCADANPAALKPS